MKILLLEDTHLFAREIQQSLEDMGYEVIWKERPEDALQEMKSDNPPDLCLFDIRLEGWNLTGLDVVERLKRELDKQIPAIIYTSHDVSNYAYQARAVGIPLQFLVDRNRLDRPIFLQQLIEDAASYYGPPIVDRNEHLHYQFRKIGICENIRESRIYHFFAKDELMFIESEDRYTKVHLYLKARGRDLKEAKSIVVTTNVGSIGKQLQNNFTNFVRITQSFWINLEQLASLEGETLYFASGEQVNIGREGRARLRQLNVMIIAN